MVKETNEKETKEAPPTQEVKEPEVKTPTQEEVVAQLQEERDAALAKAQEKEEGFKTLQQTTGRKIKQLEDRAGDIDAISAKVEVLGGMLLNRDTEASLDDVPPDKKVDYAKQFRQAESDTRVQRQIKQRQERVEALGLSETDRQYKAVRALTLSGDFKEADALLDELENKTEVSPVEEKPQKSPEEIKAEHDAEIEEAARKMLEEKGYLVSDINEPSGSTSIPSSGEEIGKMSYAEWKAKETQIDKTIREGRIK